MNTYAMIRVKGLIFALMMVFAIAVHAQITVKTFHDSNSSGAFDEGEELITGLAIHATDTKGNVYPLNDDGAGTFVLELVTSRVRLEVSGYNVAMKQGPAGPSSIFFAEDGDQIFVPVVSQGQVDPSGSMIVVPCFEKGSASDKTTSPAIVAFPYNVDGVAKQYGGTEVNPRMDATIAEIGSTWGMAYQSSRARAFASSVLKRHVDLGPGGTGAVYMLDYSQNSENPNLTSFDLQGYQPSVGPVIDLGSINREIIDGPVTDSDPFALTSIEDLEARASYDVDAFDKVGKLAYGDIDVTEDNRQLWMVNTYQRSLIALDISSSDIEVSGSKLRHYRLDDIPGMPSTDLRHIRCINTGGNNNYHGAESFTDSNSIAWDRNKYDLQTGEADYAKFEVANAYNDSEGTSASELYHTWRKGREFSYDIPIPGQDLYTVRLHFAEPYNYVGGDRIFDIVAEGVTMVDNFDIVATAGANKTATVVSFQVQATGPSLKLEFLGEFAAKGRQAIVNGIEIEGTKLVKAGDLRPWGLEFHHGRGYLGVVNDASITQSRDHMEGYVLSFDPENVEAGVEVEVMIPLNYPRERSSNADYDEPQTLRTAAWLPWVEEWEMTHIPLDDNKGLKGGLLCSYPQPIISEINFTEDGSMVINVMDRWAHQTGYLNYSTILGDQTFIIGYASGDILKAFKQGSEYVLEMTNNDDGKFYSNTDGPSYRGEFFFQDEYQSRDIAHHGELITGGAGILMGSNEVVSTVHNPIETTLEHFDFNGVFTQGIHFYNTTTGLKTHSYLFVDQYNIGKANGLGDLEFTAAAPVGEVGNYVWCDANGDGIQDPAEFGIPGIELMLLDKDNSLAPLGTTTTAADGSYVFDGLSSDHCYEIRIDLSQLTTLGYSGETAPQTGGDSLVDSNGDPHMVPGFAVAMFCTDDAASNRHDIDFGFGGPRAQDVTKSDCEDPQTGCATFDLGDVADCVRTSATQEVRFYPTFNDADSMLNEITATSMVVCDVDTMLYARVNIAGDVSCFSIAEVRLVELNSGTAPQVFNTTVCPSPTFDAVSFLNDEGLDGGSAAFYADANRTMMLANPIPVTGYPTTIYIETQTGQANCSLLGEIRIDSVPAGQVNAGRSTEICGNECVDLTTIGATFSSNSSGATSALWSSSGSGTFDVDNSFSGARFYCPSAADLAAGTVDLTLSIDDDPCGRSISSIVTIVLLPSTPQFIPTIGNDTILCTHPFVDDQVNNDTFPRCRYIVNCDDIITARVVDYDIENGDCDGIVKMIIRTQELLYDKQTYSCTDTIFVVGLDFDEFMCPPQRDTVYCHTPYLKDENGHPSPLETGVPTAGTVPLWPQPTSKCEVLIKYEDEVFDSQCPMIIHRTWSIKNGCIDTFYTCDQWLMIADTTGPDLKKDLSKTRLADPGLFPELDKPVIVVPASTHTCDAHTYIPPIEVIDSCNGVKSVKARIGEVGAVTMEYDEEKEVWVSHDHLRIPRSEEPIPLIYDVLDGCHNVSRDTCYFFVKDFTRPVTICDKGINVSVTEGTVWLQAEIFDEGSWDNCGISMMLARRTDWATACGVDLCDSIRPYCTTDHHDTLWCGVLETDPYKNEIEAHYAQTLQWLCEDGSDCAPLVVGGWWYDLIKEATLECKDHPYPVDENYLNQILKDPTLTCEEGGLYVGAVCEKLGFDYIANLPEFAAPFFSDSEETPFDIVKQIGGGWAKEVPFCCEDACQDVTVELLVMDYWCNWSKCWTKVFVEDKTPPKVVENLYDINISCTSYKHFYEEAVIQAQQGDYAALDSLLGGYDQVSADPYGNISQPKSFTYYDVKCDSILVQKDSLVYDEHEGYKWISYSHYQAVYDTIKHTAYRGQVADNCGLIAIEEMPWVALDECGNGYIKRVFKFVGECEVSPDIGHTADTIVKYQTIWIESDCQLSKSMFEVPEDQVLNSCGIVYDEDGSGNVSGVADPVHTGMPEYIFADDCKQIGIGYYDKVFKIVRGSEGCYKIIRTWCFADWCIVGDSPKENWWLDPQYDGKYFSCEQKLLLVDTIPPECTLRLPEQMVATSCVFTLEGAIEVADECGVLDYQWTLVDAKEFPVASGSGKLDGNAFDEIPVVAQIDHGIYTLRATITDDCKNRTQCEREFEVLIDKKPTPVCITTLTLDLTPMDTSGDGNVDTAMAAIAAHNFNQSSIPACGSSQEGLVYRLGRATGDPALPDEEASTMIFGCDDVGANQLRLYVLDESGTWDYCEVILMVQDNNGGCGRASQHFDKITSMVSTTSDRKVHNVQMDEVDPHGRLSDQTLVSVGEGYELHQNMPNPFVHYTTVGFRVPEATHVRLSLRDVTGRLIKVIERHAQAGYNAIELSKQDLPANGILYYTLKTDHYSSTKKMILMTR